MPVAQPPASPKSVAPAPASKPAVPPSIVASGLSRTGAAEPAKPSPSPSPVAGNFKDALLAEIRKTKAVFYNTVVAQAQKIEVSPDRVVFTFSAVQRALRDMFERDRAWLESLGQQIAGRKIAFASVQTDGAAAPASAAAGDAAPKAEAKAADKKSALKEQALADAGVQALLEVFPAEIRDVEEM
jgi:hypothetical protein